MNKSVKNTGPAIQWFPGHMAKTRRIMQENLKHVDIVIEIRDARIPHASANPVITKIIGAKPRLLLLTKEDLAEPNVTKAWIDYFQETEGVPALSVNTQSGKGLNTFPPKVKEILKELVTRREEKGMGGAAIRMMVVGVPNVGKSSLINRMAGGKRLQVEDRPGVTLRKQWMKVEGGMELLDMPGVLWPKFEDAAVGEYLAFTGAIKDDVMDVEWIAIQLITHLQKNYPKLLEDRYHFTAEETEGLQGFELVELLGRKRGMLIAGGEINFERASETLLDEFRGGVIGRVTLEKPPSNRFGGKKEH